MVCGLPHSTKRRALLRKLQIPHQLLDRFSAACYRLGPRCCPGWLQRKGDVPMKKPSGGVVNKCFRISLIAGFATLSAVGVQAQDPDQISAADVAGSHLKFTHLRVKNDGQNGATQATLAPVAGIDSVPNFSGSYTAAGVDPSGKPQDNWTFNTLGNPPAAGGTTTVSAPVVPVSLDFRNHNGSLRFVRVVNGKAHTCGNADQPGCKRLFFDATPFIQPVLESPVFSDANYTSSGIPTQFADAVARAEYQGAKADWHTLLAPSVKTERTMVINQDGSCGLKQGHCNYLFALKPDGSCCFFVLINANTFQAELFPSTSTFPPDNSTPVGAAERAGDITTKDVSTFFFPPAYLFIPTKHARPCCIGVFQTF